MKIFVARLSRKTTSDNLKTLFSQFGIVDSCKVIIDHETGLSKGYGFIEMPNENEAYKAIVETDDSLFMGNIIQVKKSRPQIETNHQQSKTSFLSDDDESRRQV